MEKAKEHKSTISKIHISKCVWGPQGLQGQGFLGSQTKPSGWLAHPVAALSHCISFRSLCSWLTGTQWRWCSPCPSCEMCLKCPCASCDWTPDTFTTFFFCLEHWYYKKLRACKTLDEAPQRKTFQIPLSSSNKGSNKPYRCGLFWWDYRIYQQ